VSTHSSKSYRERRVRRSSRDFGCWQTATNQYHQDRGRQFDDGKKSPTVEFRYQDQPLLTETYADSMGNWHFDGHSLRMEFMVHRIDAVKEGDTKGRKIPVCRLVLSPNCATDLLNFSRQLTAALAKAGLVKAQTKDGPESKTSKQ